MRHLPVLLALATLAAVAPRALPAQRPDSLSDEVRKYIAVDNAVVALTHALLIDGTGSAPHPRPTIILRNGRIADVGPAAKVAVPNGARTMDLTGHTVT